MEIKIQYLTQSQSTCPLLKSPENILPEPCVLTALTRPERCWTDMNSPSPELQLNSKWSGKHHSKGQLWYGHKCKLLLTFISYLFYTLTHQGK